MEQALARDPEGAEMLLVGILNTPLAQTRHQCKEDLATAISNHGLKDQMLHFILRWSYWGVGGVEMEDLESIFGN